MYRISVFAIICILWFTSISFSQTGGMVAISGTVHDPSGAVIPNATVVISNANLGVERKLQTNAAGIFTAPSLIPGAGYKVAVTAAQFAPYEATGLELEVGQNPNLDIALQIGAQATTVEVTAAAPLIEDTKIDVSQVVGTREIMDLPINGRRVDSFVLNTRGCDQ